MPFAQLRQGAVDDQLAERNNKAGLFGERQSRIVVSAPENDRDRLARICQEEDLPLSVLGRVGGQAFSIPGAVEVGLAELSAAWRNGLPLALSDAGAKPG